MLGLLGGLMGGVGGAIMGRIASARQAASGGGGGGPADIPDRKYVDLPPPLEQQKRQHSPLSGLLMDNEPQPQKPGDTLGMNSPRQMRA